MVRVLANRLQLVISDLIRPEQNYDMKGRSTQNNLNLVCEVLDGTEATMINLDPSKAFNRVNHRFLATVLENSGFKPEFRSMMNDNPQVVVQVNRKHPEVFAIERLVR